MKIAISSQGPETSSLVDSRFGRAKYFIIVDTVSGESVSHNNSENVDAAQGAGIQTVRRLLDFHPEAVISSNVGPKAFTALQAANIPIYRAGEGTVQDAVSRLQKGELSIISDPGSWGGS